MTDVRETQAIRDVRKGLESEPLSIISNLKRDLDEYKDPDGGNAGTVRSISGILAQVSKWIDVLYNYYSGMTVARKIALGIYTDINDRGGLKEPIGNLESWVIAEMLKAWEKIAQVTIDKKV